MTARILERIEPVLEAEQPAAAIVYGDTNTTLAAALAAAKLTIPVVHVEAGLRSFDRSMPEEVNRVVVDHLARLLLCPTEVARQNLAAEGVRDGVELTGDVMADAARLFGPLVDRRGGVVAQLGVARGGFLLATVHRDANTRPPALGRIVAGLSSLDEPVLLPLHPRTAAALRREGLAFGGSVRTLPPLGYLEFTALLRAARVLLTDSGGAQKEAYLHGVPCVTLRDRTEWTETVAAGWNRLVGDDPEQLRTAVAEARAGVGRPDLYGDGHAAERGCEADRCARRRPPIGVRAGFRPRLESGRDRDVAVIGAGYVGLPLAMRFADVGKTVVCVEPNATKVAKLTAGEVLHPGRLERRARRARRRGPHHRLDALQRGRRGERDPDLRADPADPEPRARPELRRGRRRGRQPVPPSGPARRARVHDLPGHDAGHPPADPRAHGPRLRHGLQPGHVAGAHRPGPHRLHGQDDAEGRRRDHARLHPQGGRALRVVRGRDRRGVVAGGRRADQAAREHLPLGEHRVHERDGDDVRPHGHRRLGGGRRGRHQALRLHELQAGPGLGGHCLPLDPFYLSWKAREFDFYTEFIELAGKVNENMPYFCMQKINRALNSRQKSVRGAKVLLLGLAYKADIDDLRESPALKLIELLVAEGADVAYHDPFVPTLGDDGHGHHYDPPLRSVELTNETLAASDCVAIVTAHSQIDYANLVEWAPVVVDFRNATRNVPTNGNVHKL
jgi:UDP-N-acetylglucosamine 2-epimerase